MHYSKIIKRDFANGPGVRVSLFVSGCSRQCPGCFNSEAWDPNFGKEFTKETIEEILNSIDDKCEGLSLLGGDPLEDCNLNGVYDLILAFRNKFGYDKTIWLWTGYDAEFLVNDPLRARIVNAIDVLVDGPFIEEKKDLSLAFRGSSNQRIIDIRASQYFSTMILKDI